MNQTKKNMKDSILFLLILAVLIAVCSLVFRPKNNRREDGFFRAAAYSFLAEPENTMDVLFVGDSLCGYSVLPMQIWEDYGIPCNVSSFGDMMLYDVNEAIEEFCKRQQPKMIFVEVNTSYLECLPEKMFFNQVQEYIPLFRFHDHWKTLKFHDLTSGVSYRARSFKMGATEEYGTQGMAPTDYMRPVAEEPMRQENQDYFRKISGFCRKNGIELVLFSAPSAVHWDYGKHLGVERIAGELEVPYLDMNLMTDRIPIDWRNETTDEGKHINYWGARKATDYLGAYLEATGLFSDKREEAAYSFWNESLKEYHDNIKEMSKNQERK